MRLLFSIMFLLTSFTLTAKDTGLEKKQITLDLKPDFNATLKHQDKSNDNTFLHTPDNQMEEKNIFNDPTPPKHTFTIGVGATAGKAAT